LVVVTIELRNDHSASSAREANSGCDSVDEAAQCREVADCEDVRSSSLSNNLVQLFLNCATDSDGDDLRFDPERPGRFSHIVLRIT